MSDAHYLFLRELAKQHGAQGYHLMKSTKNDSWHASIEWGDRDAGEYPLTTGHLTVLRVVAASEQEAVDKLAAGIPAHREQLRAKLPEFIKRLRELSKTI